MSNQRRAVILTAGKGSRLKERTSFLNKGLLKVGDKATISHTIDSFPEDIEFVIALGYQGDLVRQYLEMVYPNRKFTFVDVDKIEGVGSGPGYSLRACQSHLQCPFYFVSCDAIIDWGTVLPLDYSWAGCATVAAETKHEYCTLRTDDQNKIVDHYDKSKDGTTDAFIGVAYIKEYESFWEKMQEAQITVESEIQVAPSILTMPNIMAAKVLWFDTGNEESYLRAKQHFGGFQNLDKLDEEIYFVGGHAVKYFHNEKNVAGRMKRSGKMKGLIPDIISSSKNYYKYKFVEGQDLFNVDNIDEVMSLLLDFSKNKLWQDVELDENDSKAFKACCMEFYYNKTMMRLRRLFSEKGIVDSENVINGLNVPTARELLTLVDWADLSSGVSSGYHGDFCLANVLLDQYNDFKLIDYRQDFCGISSYGDRYYDFAKIYCSFFFPQPSVKKGLYSVTQKESVIQTSMEIPEDLDRSRQHFEDFIQKEGYNLNKIKVLMAIVMLNMSPLHEAPQDSWLFYFGKYYLTMQLKQK